jgi:hydrogenase expression/formation protein HypC
MCLAIPGKLLSRAGANPLQRTGRVDLGGVVHNVNLALTPEAEIGDFLLIHAGVAIGVMSTELAQQTLQELESLSEEE